MRWLPSANGDPLKGNCKLLLAAEAELQCPSEEGLSRAPIASIPIAKYPINFLKVCLCSLVTKLKIKAQKEHMFHKHLKPMYILQSLGVGFY